MAKPGSWHHVCRVPAELVKYSVELWNVHRWHAKIPSWPMKIHAVRGIDIVFVNSLRTSQGHYNWKTNLLAYSELVFDKVATQTLFLSLKIRWSATLRCPNNTSVEAPRADSPVCTDESGTAHMAGSSWRTDECTSCTCTNEGKTACYREECPVDEQLNCKGSPLVIKGRCCPVCSDVLSSSAVCSYQSSVYSVGEQWQEGACSNCSCVAGGQTICRWVEGRSPKITRKPNELCGYRVMKSPSLYSQLTWPGYPIRYKP